MFIGHTAYLPLLLLVRCVSLFVVIVVVVVAVGVEVKSPNAGVELNEPPPLNELSGKEPG
jgi:hypothetical protein